MFRKIYSAVYLKACRKVKGIPVLTIVYKPRRKGKNVFTYAVINPFDDDYVESRCKEIAEHIRENYQDEISKIMEGEDG